MSLAMTRCLRATRGVKTSDLIKPRYDCPVDQERMQAIYVVFISTDIPMTVMTDNEYIPKISNTACVLRLARFDMRLTDQEADTPYAYTEADLTEDGLALVQEIHAAVEAQFHEYITVTETLELESQGEVN